MEILKPLLLDRADMYIEEDSELIKQLTCEHDIVSEVVQEWYDGDHYANIKVWYCTKCDCEDYDMLGI